MAWIESHTVLIRHRKLRELALSLRLSPVYALGHLHVLWHAALEQQEDGDLSGWSDEFIAEASSFNGGTSQFVLLLQQHGWLDGRLIHDWLDYAGRYLESKYRTSDPQKLERIWAKHGQVWPQSDSRRTKDGPPDLTPPNPTKPKTKASAPSGAAAPKVGKAPIPNWQVMVDHIGAKWTEKKKKKTGNAVPFPWPENKGPGANIWSELRSKASLYQAAGIMALWDVYLEMDDNWVLGTGHSLGAFFHKIPVLVDDIRWKSLSAKYENQMSGPLPSDLLGVLSGTVKNQTAVKRIA